MSAPASRTNGFLFADLRDYTRYVESRGGSIASAHCDGRPNARCHLHARGERRVRHSSSKLRSTVPHPIVAMAQIPNPIGRYAPRMGWQPPAIGSRASLRHTFTADDVEVFAALTGD